MNNAYMIIDLQFGSTGKGLLAGYLAKKHKPDTVVTAWGPNAGHTYIDEDGREFIHRMLANGVVSPNLKTVLVGPGSVIDVEILMNEIESCADLLNGKTIVIHPHAAIVTSEHLESEKANVSIGSTMKGTGAAVIQRIMRNPHRMNTAKAMFPKDAIAEAEEKFNVTISVCEYDYAQAIRMSDVMQIEGAQGFSLSIYHGIYPYTTSRDVTPHQVLADCALPYGINPLIFGTMRTFPIRVANRFDAEGNMIGTSGPGYPDQYEMDWSKIGVEPELTTVTKLPRRIFNFSPLQCTIACEICRPDSVFLNFTNYMDNSDVATLVKDIERWGNTHVEFIGTGPAHQNVLEGKSKEYWLSTGIPF